MVSLLPRLQIGDISQLSKSVIITHVAVLALGASPPAGDAAHLAARHTKDALPMSLSASSTFLRATLLEMVPNVGVLVAAS